MKTLPIPAKGKENKIKKYVKSLVKALAYVAIFLLSGYGLRSMFAVMQDGLSIVLTAGIVSLLAYVIFLTD